MRRTGLATLLTVLTATACGSFRDVFTSHAETAARVGSRELPSAKVAEIISRLGGPTANPQAADLIAGIWVDMALFADRIAQGNLGNDSATMVKLMWPQIVESKIQAWHDSVISSRTGRRSSGFRFSNGIAHGWSSASSRSVSMSAREALR